MQKKNIEIIPPSDPVAEAALLGSLLSDYSLMDKSYKEVRETDFMNYRNRQIYKAMLAAYSENKSFDIVSIANSLKAENPKIHNELAAIMGGAFSTTEIKRYVEIVKRHGFQRELISMGSKIQELGYDEARDVKEVVDDIGSLFMKTIDRNANDNIKPFSANLSEASERMKTRMERGSGLIGEPSGFKDLDNILGGLPPSNLLILAARPSVGKTSLALDIARHVANNNKSVVIFSLEQSKEELTDKLLCAQARASTKRMRLGTSTNEEWQRILQTVASFGKVKIAIDDSSALNILELKATARKIKSEGNLDLIVVDYLQLMEASKTANNRAEAVSEMSKGLKTIAKELKVPVLALAQVNRMVESREGGDLKLSDLRESGSIEQDADIVMFLKRESLDSQGKDFEKKLATLTVAKHRSGPTGKLELYWDPDLASFRNMDRKHEYPTNAEPDDADIEF